MPLPTEVLLVILENLSRDDLDAIAISNRMLSDVCDANFDQYPLRPVTLMVDSPAGGTTIRNTSDGRRYCNININRLAIYLQRAVISNLTLSGRVNMHFLDLLRPFADKFRTAALTHNCHWDRKFDAADVFLSAYSDVFFFRHLEFDQAALREAQNPANAPTIDAALLTLPCLLLCSSLLLEKVSLADAGALAEWLTSGGEKTLTMKYTPLIHQDAFLLELKENIIHNFRSATTSVNFSVNLSYNARGEPGKETTVYENDTTFEKLAVTVERTAYGR